MKLVLLFACIFLQALFLSSCEAHMGTYTFDVPWYCLAGIVIVIFILAHILIIRQTYRCKNCGAEFKPRWYELSAWIHLNGDRVMRCPCCHKKASARESDKPTVYKYFGKALENRR